MANKSDKFHNTQKYEINCMGEPTVSTSDVKVSSNSRSIVLHRNKQLSISEEISPYVSSHSLSKKRYALKNQSRCDSGLIGAKIMSAKIIKMKELESELNLKRKQLNEVLAENRILRSLQRRQELALKNYEQSKGQLPQLIQSHSEEMKVLKSKCKKMSMQNRDLEKKLREKETDLLTLQDQHRHLLKLSKDRSLGEREKLHEEVTSLKQLLEAKEDQLQELSKKRAIEHKVHQQQMQQEINRSKECRKALLCAEKQIHHLEVMLKKNGKNITPEKITTDFSKMMKASSAVFDQRFPSIIQNFRGIELDNNIKAENGVKSKPMQVIEKIIDLSIKSPEDETDNSKLKINKVENKKYKNESGYLDKDFMKSVVYHTKDTHQNYSESDQESEVNRKAEDAKTIEMTRKKSPETEVPKKPSDINEYETVPKEKRIDSSKKAELLRALKEMDSKESSDSEMDEISFTPSTSLFQSKACEKSPIKFNALNSKTLLVEERRKSIGNSKSIISNSSPVRNSIQKDLMKELFEDHTSSDNKIRKNSYVDSSPSLLGEIGS